MRGTVDIFTVIILVKLGNGKKVYRCLFLSELI